MASYVREGRNELRGMIYSVYPILSECAQDLGCGINTLTHYIRGDGPLPLKLAVKLSSRVGVSLDEFVRRVYPEMVSEASHDA